MSNDDKDSTFKAVPHVTDAYHRARRNLIIVSGMLLAWEYVGVRVDKTTAELPGTKTPVYLANPDVLPHVIFLLVLYFLVRLSVEWFQCDSARRQQWPCQLDIFVALSLALSAIVLFTYHNILAGTHAISLEFRITMILTAFLYTMIVAAIIRNFYRENIRKGIIIWSLLTMLLLMFIFVASNDVVPSIAYIAGANIASLLLLLLFQIGRAFRDLKQDR